jgi:hypothetical protein
MCDYRQKLFNEAVKKIMILGDDCENISLIIGVVSNLYYVLVGEIEELEN